MSPDLFWVPGPWQGKLAIAARPRGGDWLEDEIAAWRQAGLDVVVSLLEQDEAAQLGLSLEASIANAKGVHFVSFPIPDCGVPQSTHDALALLSNVAAMLEAGKNVSVHCRQGLGRSGIIACGLLVQSGLRADETMRIVSSARGHAVPETPVQIEWIKHLPSRQLIPAS